MTRFKAPLAILALVAALIPIATHGQAVRTWRTLLSSHPEPLFYRATGIAVGGSNNIFVADSGDHRIKKFSPSGESLAVWGTDTAGPSRFAGPFGVAVDSRGTVYVADTDLVQLSSGGRVLTRLRVPAPGSPTGIAVDGKRNVYVLSIVRTWYNHAISRISVTRFEPNGRVANVWSQAVRHDPEDQLFTASLTATYDGTMLLSVEGQVHCHACDGTYDQLWTISTARKKIQIIATGFGGGGVAVDPQSNVFLSARGRVIEVGPTGNVLGSWGTAGCGPGRLGPDVRLAYHAGGLYLADTQPDGGTFSGNLQVLIPPAGQFGWHGYCVSPGPVHVDSPPVIGPGNAMYLAFQAHIDRYDLSGVRKDGFDIPPGYPPGLLATDRSGNLYISDVQNSILTVVSPAGTQLARVAPIAFLTLVIGPSGVLYGVAMQDPNSVTVAKPINLARGGTTIQAPRILAHWSLRGYAAHSSGLLPGGIAIDPWGSVFVADTRHSYVQKFSHKGSIVAVWGTGQGSRPGQFSNPASVVVDSRGNVYVADTGNSRIQEISPRGRLLHMWGRKGMGSGQFNHPRGLAVDRYDRIYVQDGNGRIVVFGG